MRQPRRVRPKTILRERRERLARRLRELAPNRPPFAVEERWRKHHGQGWCGDIGAYDRLEAEAMALELREFNRRRIESEPPVVIFVIRTNMTQDVGTSATPSPTVVWSR